LISERVHQTTGMAYTEAGDGPAVVLIHGWACDRSFWRNQIEALSGVCRVIAPDFRGHGGSSVPEDGYTLARLAGDIHSLCHDLGTAPFVLVGHSMGGMVAQRYALDHPDDLAGLALVATAAADPEKALVSRQIASVSPTEGFRSAFLRYSRSWFTPDSEPDLVLWLEERMLHTPEHVALKLVAAYGEMDVREELLALYVPTLVIGARGDVSTPVDRSVELSQLIPGASLVTVDKAGHFVQLERPDEVNEALMAFLAGIGHLQGQTAS
jgi:pimeloyl-ACP methyl ester carboxylesterase